MENRPSFGQMGADADVEKAKLIDCWLQIATISHTSIDDGMVGDFEVAEKLDQLPASIK